MKGGTFVKGLGVGMVVGAAAYMLMVPRNRKRGVREAAGRAIKAIGDAVENCPTVV